MNPMRPTEQVFYLAEARDCVNGSFQPLNPERPLPLVAALRELGARRFFYDHTPNVLRDDSDGEGFVVVTSMSAGHLFVVHVRLVSPALSDEKPQLSDTLTYPRESRRMYIDLSGALHFQPAPDRRTIPRWLGVINSDTEDYRLTFDRADDRAEWIPFYSVQWVGGIPSVLRWKLAHALFERSSV